MKRLKIIFGDYIVYAKLHYDKAPRLIAALEKESPITGLVRHARVCENEWMLPIPSIDINDEENPIRPVPGDISVHRPGAHICSWYAPMTPLGTTNVFASVAANELAEYEKQWRTVWRKPGAKVTVEIVEGGA
ncbi:MAG: DUF3830 family protein [Spirochaetaceae bacterium]|nr:DUF3830 family protein [Spirochaetaceae bacterium]